MTAHPGAGDSAPSGEQDLNALTRYTMWSVFKIGRLDTDARAAAGDDLAALLDKAPGGVTTRGVYDLQGMRADADVMFWWIADTAEALQRMYVLTRRSLLGRSAEPVWSAVGMHRPAEFNRAHVPAFLAGEEPRDWLCVYPFVRSYEWYLLPEEQRRELLAEHGRMAAGFADVRANTVSTFALSDYEWLLGFEADAPHRLVDLMRHLRGARARRHTREEIPFFTGRRTSAAELAASLA